MSVHGQLMGLQWGVWTEPLGPGSPPGDLVGRGRNSLRNSPTPASEDVMKLPREDMHTFGRCPAWDNFVLVTCDKCDKNVKIEAFESHMTLRHGSKSERSAYHRAVAAKAAAAMETCQVKLTPALVPGVVHFSDSTPTNSSSNSVELPLPIPDLPTSTSTSPQAVHSHMLDSTSVPPTRSPSPQPEEHIEEPMDSSPPPPSQTPTASLPKYVGEEADSTTNNVISIPDSVDIHNLEIISEGQSLLDSIDSKFNFSHPVAPPPAPPSHSAPSVDSTSPVLNYCPAPAPSPTQRSMVALSPISNVRNAPEPMEVEQTAPSVPTHYITVSPLSKHNSSPKKMVVGRVVQPHVAHPQQPAAEKKATGREREYDANKHCGVWDADAKRNCTRSLTCKSHSVYLKRKVLNRSGGFDELLANHKAEKEAAANKTASTHHEDSNSTSILERRLKLSSGTGNVNSMNTVNMSPARVVGQIQVMQTVNVKAQPKEMYSEDTLHYTTDHPKPLAVCTFGGKRVGGLFIADRSRLLTRKVMRVALSSSGLRTTPLVRQQAMPYIVNFQGGSTISTISGIPNLSGISGLSSTARIGTIKLANSVGNIQPQQIIVQDAFKSDLPEFKGGLKFELGRNIHQILPSGSEGAG